MEQFRIVVLGPRLSGKTVFLGCMYNDLSLPKHGFFLSCDDEQQIVDLLNIYNQIANTNDDAWPRATPYSELLTAAFTCVADVSGIQYPAFRFSYLDYAGERFEQSLEGEDPNREFGAALKHATSVVGMIDGCDMLDLIDGKMTDNDMRIRYGAILRIMLRHTSGKPIHFILTKWDLFERRRIRLEKVAARLENTREFRHTFASRKESAIPIRLLPVTSIGEKFAEPEGDTGRVMKKIQGASPQGYNLAMPLACAMYDQLQTIVEKLRDQAYRQATRRQRFHLRFHDHGQSFLGVLRRVPFNVVDDLVRTLPLTLIQRTMLLALVQTAQKGRDAALKRLIDIANKDQDPASAIGVDVLRGIEYTFVSFTALVDELDRIRGTRLVFD